MNRILIFGNSGSGKSLLAGQTAKMHSCPHFDLDTVAWESDSGTPIRKSLPESLAEMEPFLNQNSNWVIEGCYADLIELVIGQSTEIIFLNPGIETCVANCRNRPWEPHKYESLAEQNANLEMLLAWIAQYDQRDDEFSLVQHRRIFDDYAGMKQEFTSNERNN